MLMICETCGKSEEVDDDNVMRAIAATAASAQFTLRRVMVEAKGLCGRCTGAR
jgi:Fe2+ or Zn2+ uptake regulation protein